MGLSPRRSQQVVVLRGTGHSAVGVAKPERALSARDPSVVSLGDATFCFCNGTTRHLCTAKGIRLWAGATSNRRHGAERSGSKKVGRVTTVEAKDHLGAGGLGLFHRRRHEPRLEQSSTTKLLFLAGTARNRIKRRRRRVTKALVPCEKCRRH